MSRSWMAAAAAIPLALPAAPALAQQDGATIATAESEAYGQYLVDGEGRPVYLFTPDTQGQDGAEPASTCHDACAEAWPPVISSTEPQAEGAAQADMLGRMERQDGAMQVTYNGWPLYTFVRDQGADQPAGQDVEGFGGEWYLLQPSGERIGHD